MQPYPIRGLFGCEPDKFSTNRLNINAGWIADYYGTDVLELPDETQINLSVNGCWGLDTGSPSNGELYIYAIKNAVTGHKALIASKCRFQGGVTYPPGYTMMRKLPWGVMYNTLWDGIPNFHLTHWPMPEIRFTDSEYASPWLALFAAQSQGWAPLDLSAYIPDNARLAHIFAEVRYTSGSAGSAYLRTHGGQSTGLLVGSASPGSPFPGQVYVPIRVTSDRKIEYKTTGNAQLYVQVLGYVMTEPA